MTIKRLTAFVAAVCLTLLLTLPALAQSPSERVKEATEQLITLLSDPAMSDPGNHQQAVVKLRQVADEYIDFRLVTMFAVGRAWLDMSPQMQHDLTAAFINLLERTYLKRIPSYGGQKVEFTGERISGKKATTTAIFTDKDKQVVVEFRLRDVKGTWMIYDMVAEGVSLAANYRSQFAQVLSDGTPEDLLETIKKRIRQLDEAASEQTEDNS